MKNLIVHCALILFLAVLINSTALCFAQAAEEIEINMDTLDDIKDYQPPPMFQEGAPLTSPRLQKETEIIELGSLLWKKIPRPKRKPYFGRTPPPPVLVEDESIAPPAPVKVQDIPEPVRTAKVPLPPHRPQKAYASKTFVRKAREEYLVAVPAIPVEKEPLVEIKPDIKKPEESNDPLERTLIEQDSRAVLASIDPEAHLPPLPEKPIEKPGVLSLGYQAGVTDLPQDIQSLLHERLVLKLQKSQDSRVEIIGFASVVNDQQNSDRRIALARALAVRDFLVQKNITPSRIDIRALGSNTDRSPVDRVDLILINAPL